MNRLVALFQMNSAIFLFGLSAILATQMMVHPVMIVWGRSVFAILALTLIMVPGPEAVTVNHQGWIIGPEKTTAGKAAG